jgi:hypothetical protein
MFGGCSSMCPNALQGVRPVTMLATDALMGARYVAQSFGLAIEAFQGFDLFFNAVLGRCWAMSKPARWTREDALTLCGRGCFRMTECFATNVGHEVVVLVRWWKQVCKSRLWSADISAGSAIHHGIALARDIL